MDRILANFSRVGISRATIVVGYCASAILDRLDDLADRYDLQIEVVHNDHAEDRNNAYSLWCARDRLRRGVLLCNGDTLHPAQVQSTVLRKASPITNIRLAVDDMKALGDEEMKVSLDRASTLRDISKGLPHDSTGEYIGVALIPPSAAPGLIEALEHVWVDDHNSFYEAAFQRLADNGAVIEGCPIGQVDWIEIDSLDDLARANELICRS